MGKIQLQNFLIVYDRGDAVFRAGEYVSGKCIILLDGELNLNQLEIRLKGKSYVHWTETESYGTGDNRTTDTVTYSSVHPILNLRYFPASVNSSIITRGEHHIPFAFQLPINGIASSFEGRYGHIRYRVEAEIHKPELLSFNHKIKNPIIIIAPAFASIQELSNSVSGANKKEIGFNLFSKPKFAEITANISRVGNCTGKAIAVNCSINNSSTKTITPRVTLKQYQTFYASCDLGLGYGQRQKHEHFKITRGVGTPIGPNQSVTQSIPLIVPEGIPVLHNQCPNITVSYCVAITLDIPGSFDLHLDLPVIITNQPLPFDYQ